jgi:hypothetical protein
MEAEWQDRIYNAAEAAYGPEYGLDAEVIVARTVSAALAELADIMNEQGDGTRRASRFVRAIIA